jgi:class 3 adenylate cyclase
MALAVLVVTLNDPESLWVGLSVHHYFALVSDVVAQVREVVGSLSGQAVRLAPYRFVCHFLPAPGDAHLDNALVAARRIADAIRRAAPGRKEQAGAVEILANVAVAAGEAWVCASANGDLQVVGDVVPLAVHVGSVARPGSILMTRDLVGRLPAPVRDALVYGVPDRSSPSVRHLMTFARLRDIGSAPAIPRRIADLPVTEFVAVRDDAPAASKELA